jgi:hypothetical protein
MARLSENSLAVTQNKSYSLTAEIEVPKAGANGVIVALGGGVGGWSLDAKNRRLNTATTSSASSGTTLRAQQIPAGKHQVRMEFRYDGGGQGRHRVALRGR